MRAPPGDHPRKTRTGGNAVAWRAKKKGWNKIPNKISENSTSTKEDPFWRHPSIDMHRLCKKNVSPARDRHTSGFISSYIANNEITSPWTSSPCHPSNRNFRDPGPVEAGTDWIRPETHSFSQLTLVWFSKNRYLASIRRSPGAFMNNLIFISSTNFPLAGVTYHSL